MNYIINKEMDRHFKEMDKAIRESDIMNVSLFWEAAKDFFSGNITLEEWEKRLEDNIYQHLKTEKALEELGKEERDKGR